MTLSPADLRSADLPRSIRGYDVEATRSLIGQAADQLQSARATNDRLEEKISQLEEELRQLGQDRGASPPPEETERRIGEAFMAATQAADELRQQARRDADDTVLEARDVAQEILDEAVEERESITKDADARAEAVLKQAQNEAQRMLAEGEQERQGLKEEAERLRRLTDEMSASLRSLLLGMLEKFDRPFDQFVQDSARASATEPQNDRDDGEPEPTLVEDLRPSVTTAQTERRD